MTRQFHNTRFDDNDLLYSQQFQDHYYSRHDGRLECRHVFLDGNDLPQRWVNRPKFTIGELGFGTGLNFLVTWHLWQQKRQPGQQLTFLSVEGFPLDVETARHALSQWTQPKELVELAAILLESWDDTSRPLQIDAQTTLQVHHNPVEKALQEFSKTDAWFLDGFAPAKNPDMWSPQVMQLVADRTAPGGTFASYTAAGWVRRNLEDAGFTVVKRPGFASKRDMIAGVLR
ncbi:MAG: tRNA (5-methylaminomethyl-2-thiouridine)(34)-methyltransferase MnmD [Rhizobiaceae bacterium]|nr:tRNA (5-methylaminomethyl-2-thiouridine)(34)-methyltransferase MnmD [Rhizobiaceae bacterium]